MSSRFFTNHESNTLLKKFEGIFAHTKRSPSLLRRATFPELYEVPEKLISVDMAAGGQQLRVAYDASHIHLYRDDWKPLPIPVVDSATQASIAKLVEQILIARRASPSADITVLENAIDVRVKEAFGIQ